MNEMVLYDNMIGLEKILIVITGVTLIGLAWGIIIALDIRNKLIKLGGTDKVVEQNTKAIDGLNVTLRSIEKTMSNLEKTVLINQNEINIRLENLAKQQKE